MSALTDVLPPKVRKWLYTTYAGVGVLIGATQVGFQTQTGSLPHWLETVFAVYGYLAIPLGAVASANVRTNRPPSPKEDLT